MPKFLVYFSLYLHCFVVLELRAWGSRMLGKQSSTEIHPIQLQLNGGHNTEMNAINHVDTQSPEALDHIL